MTTFTAHAAGHGACELPDFYNSRFPSATLKCVGLTLYRSQEACDYACLLELDPDVISWRCVTQPFFDDTAARKPRHRYVDFAVQKEDETLLVDIWRGSAETTAWLSGVAERLGYRYHPISIFDLNPTRIQNARDLVRYGGRDAALGDRIRILAALDEMGSLTLAECLGAVREGARMGSVANMILRRMLEVDLDEKLLEPDTIVRRARS
jgi:hypothetical protein